MLLKSVMEAVSNHEGVDEIYLHVQTSNEDAINFYSKHGFITKDVIRNYYKRIEPPDCYILSKSLLSSSSSLPPPPSSPSRASSDPTQTNISAEAAGAAPPTSV